MAFIFLQETGSGTVAGANSYTSVAFADDYFAPDARRLPTWSAKTAAEKEGLLALATSTLDALSTYEGILTVETSPLRWPRTGATTRDLVAIGGTVIPSEVQKATVELAYLMISTDLNAASETAGIRRILVDVIEIEYQEGPTKSGVSPSKVPAIINALLYGLGRFSVGGRRSTRIRRA